VILPRPLLALGLALALHAPSAGAKSPKEGYSELELFARVLSYVENNYVETVDQKKLMYGAIKGMLGTLDPHTDFLPPEVFSKMRTETSGEFGGLGIEVARKDEHLVVVAPIDDTPAARAGLRPGDQILAIDGHSTRDLDLAGAVERLRGPAGKQVVLRIMREGFNAPQDIAIIRDHIRVVSVEGALHGGIGHVRLKNFQDRTDTSLRKELERLRGQNGGRELRGLVLDLRNNPGGLLDQAVAVSDRFLAGEQTIVSTRGRSGRLVSEEKSKARDTERDYPLVVLVNAGSASASEIVAGALQDHGRAVVMGTPTFGKGSVQTVIELEDGSGLKLTIARYYTPKGRSIQERGILPDYVVPEREGPPPGKELREKDLQRHFKGEGPEAPLTVRPPPPTAKWAPTEAITDPQLKVALEFLNERAVELERRQAKGR
jgi:carboxyl-terminal processing protease